MSGLADKKEIIRQLKEKILSMEGFSAEPDRQLSDFGLGMVNAAFPGGTFPVGAIHEFISPTPTCAAAANGFMAGLLSVLMKKEGICLWVSAGRILFPPALKFFGIEPHRVIFIDVKRDKEALWVMEQGLKCNSLAAVVAGLRNISFAESRRLQLAVETSKVTGFLHRLHPRTENTLACVSRWKIRPLPSRTGGLPGVGFPCLEVELVKIRNGRPGIWQFEWRNGTFSPVPDRDEMAPPAPQKQQNYA
ncbi:ImuA family protein [Gaoshiqia sp. Z1-71]|uniref:ImuA family protein n=1 Tax=Gaoshiqia hydrogeniformans TaxID=3290090 RepID=UPI003BF7A6CE